MACSKYEYVKLFEQPVYLLKNTFIVIRIDGHNFHKFTLEHKFQKPNDKRGLDLANHCAKLIMESSAIVQDLVFAYGSSDEYSFVFRRSTALYKRKSDKLSTLLVSLFTSNYVFYWNQFFKDTPLLYPPSFDARAVCYPTIENLRDYLSWRQADCHINNLYNTAFWTLIQNPPINPTPSDKPLNPITNKYMTEKEATLFLKETDSAAKNEILFSSYGINYNSLPAIFRKGSMLYKVKKDCQELVKNKQGREDGQIKYVTRQRIVVELDHVDIISDKFWKENPDVLL